MRTLFRLQQSYNNIFRVGDVFSGRPDCQYTSVQDAINAAVAAGHTNNTNPALIEIYQKNGNYVENITLYPGIHLIGIGGSGRQNQIGITGSLTYNPGAGTRLENRVTLENIVMLGVAGSDNITIGGTGQFEFAVYNCNFFRDTHNDGYRLFTKTNTQVGGNARVLWVDSTMYFTDTANPGIDVFLWNGGRFRVYGANSSFGTDSSNVNSLFRFTGNSQFAIASDSADSVISCGQIDNIFLMDTALGVYEVRNSNINIFGFGTTDVAVVRYNQNARFDFKNCGIRLPSDLSFFAADGGSGGQIVIGNCYFNAPSNPSGQGNVSRSYIDPTLEFSYDAPRAQVEVIGSQIIGYVGEFGFPTIAEALDWFQFANAFRPVLMIAPGTYDEDLVIPPGIGGGISFVGSNQAFNATQTIFGSGLSFPAELISNITLNTDDCDGVAFYNMRCVARDGAPFLSITGGSYTASGFINCLIVSNDPSGEPIVRFNTTLGGNEVFSFKDCNIDRNATVDTSIIETTTATGKTISFSNCVMNIAAPTTFNGNVKCRIAYTNGGNIFVPVAYCQWRGNSGEHFRIGDGDTVEVLGSNCDVNTAGGSFCYFAGTGGTLVVKNSQIGVNQGLGQAIARDGDQADASIELTGNSYAAGDGFDVNGTSFINGVDFAVGASIADTAQNLSDAINNAANGGDPNLQNKIYSTVNGDNVDLWSIPWTNAANSFTVANILSPPATITPWSNGADGAGGQFTYGACAFPNANLVQANIGIYQMPDTVNTF